MNRSPNLVFIFMLIFFILFIVAQYFSYITSDQKSFWEAENSVIDPIHANWMLVGGIYFCVLVLLTFGAAFLLFFMSSSYLYSSSRYNI